MDPEVPEGKRPQPFIRDRIRCKGCGREDEYAVTPQANWSVHASAARSPTRISGAM